MSLIRALLVTVLAAVCSLAAVGQYTAPYVGLTGSLSSANGMPASNYVITFVPSQVMYVGGTSTVVLNANCGTDANGAIVGTPNPSGPAILSVTPGTGTLPPANYYVEITWLDAFGHETLPSPEANIQLNVAGSVVVSPPAGGAPLSAVSMNVYIGTSSGTETYQGRVNTVSTYTQSAALTSPAPQLPIMNATVCMVVANDAAWPIGGYQMNFTTPAGNNVPGFPQQVQFIGPGSAFNISNGLPLWNGRVTYPVPILTLPYNHNAQSIAGPLSMQGYNVYSVGHLGVNTSLPAYGVDVEGSGLGGAVNANSGYLVNGSGGTIGHCLGSDGTYYDADLACVTSLPVLYYQTVINGSHATDAVAQAGYIALGSGTGLVAQTVTGVGSQVTRTVFNLNTFPTTTTLGFDPYAVVTAGGGTAGQFACWDGTTGGILGSSTPCAAFAQDRFGTLAGCTFANDGGGLNCTAGTITWSPAFADTSYIVGCWPMYSIGIAGGSSTQPSIDLNATINSVSQITVTEGVAQGSSGGFLVSPSYGLTIVCHAHHN